MVGIEMTDAFDMEAARARVRELDVAAKKPRIGERDPLWTSKAKREQLATAQRRREAAIQEGRTLDADISRHQSEILRKSGHDYDVYCVERPLDGRWASRLSAKEGWHHEEMVIVDKQSGEWYVATWHPNSTNKDNLLGSVWEDPRSVEHYYLQPIDCKSEAEYKAMHHLGERSRFTKVNENVSGNEIVNACEASAPPSGTYDIFGHNCQYFSRLMRAYISPEDARAKNSLLKDITNGVRVNGSITQQSVKEAAETLTGQDVGTEEARRLLERANEIKELEFNGEDTENRRAVAAALIEHQWEKKHEEQTLQRTRELEEQERAEIVQQERIKDEECHQLEERLAQIELEEQQLESLKRELEVEDQHIEQDLEELQHMLKEAEDEIASLDTNVRELEATLKELDVKYSDAKQASERFEQERKQEQSVEEQAQQELEKTDVRKLEEEVALAEHAQRMSRNDQEQAGQRVQRAKQALSEARQKNDKVRAKKRNAAQRRRKFSETNAASRRDMQSTATAMDKARKSVREQTLKKSAAETRVSEAKSAIKSKRTTRGGSKLRSVAAKQTAVGRERSTIKLQLRQARERNSLTHGRRIVNAKARV